MSPEIIYHTGLNGSGYHQPNIETAGHHTLLRLEEAVVFELLTNNEAANRTHLSEHTLLDCLAVVPDIVNPTSELLASIISQINTILTHNQTGAQIQLEDEGYVLHDFQNEPVTVTNPNINRWW